MRITYRPVVDGLRYIAKMLVSLHHLNLPTLSGGFVGGCVFLLSGYLITAIFLAESEHGAVNYRVLAHVVLGLVGLGLILYGNVVFIGAT